MTRNATVAPRHSINWALVLAVLSIVLAVAVAILAARPGAKPASKASAPVVASAAALAPVQAGLLAKETFFDFGSISMAAGKVSHRYWFRNEGYAAVQIRKIYTSCMCTTATFVKGMRVVNQYGMPGHGPLPAVNETLAPGEAAYIDAVFDPAAHGPAGLGPTDRVVTVESNSGQPLQLRFSANVRP
jgi:hypothetical protein